MLEPDECYEIIKARDARFDGVFFVGVSTTGVYCRPVCRVRTPGRDRCSFFRNAAGAEAAGFRPCMRCRPELAPGSSPVDSVQRVARIAVARIEAGALTDGGVDALAAELGLGSRQLRRVIEREYGVGPLALAQTRRLLLAKHLLTDTRLRVVEVAFASGFSSLRQFNRSFRERYRMNPMALRKRRKVAGEGGITLELAYRPPLPWAPLMRFLASRGAPSTERVEGTRFVRTVQLGGHAGWIAAEPAKKHDIVHVQISLSLTPVLPQLLARIRRLFDLDASPTVIDAHLRRDRRLAPLVRRVPGMRIPGALDGFELALRVVLGQQISVKAATTLYGRFVHAFGVPVDTPWPGLDRTGPSAERVADADLRTIIDLGLPQRRAETVHRLARAIAEGELRLEPGTDVESTRARMQEMPGIGPWTIDLVAMRALGDPSAFPDGDLGLMRTLGARTHGELRRAAEAWRPWRAYAAVRLWNKGSGG